MARDHDGTDDVCYRSGSEAAFEFTTTESYTLACWVRHDSLTGKQSYITKGLSGPTANYFLGKTATTHLPSWEPAGVASSIVGTTALSANTWYFVAAVRHVGDDELRLYLATASGDVGLELSTADLSTGTHGTVATGLGIGRATDSSLEAMNGRIAEVSIWNRALSLNELRSVKWGGLKDRAGLLAYWPLWGVADPEADLSGNGRHLTVFGAVRADHAPIGSYAPFPLGV